MDLLGSECVEQIFREELRRSMIKPVKGRIEHVGRSEIRIAPDGTATGLDKLLSGGQVVPAFVDLHPALDSFVAETSERQLGNDLEPAAIAIEIESLV